MDAAEAVANHFDSIVERCNRDPSGRPKHLPKNDQIIYYVISARCEMDINGFESVFDQLLTQDELSFLIDSLNEIGAPSLAQSFAMAQSRLAAAGFFGDDSVMVGDLVSDDEDEFLADIESEIRKNDMLWSIDERLIELIPGNST